MSSSTSIIVESSLTTIKQNPLKRKFHEITNEEKHDEPPSPSWEILSLLGHYMEPKTLLAASTVSTTWFQCFYSENIWKSLLRAHYPGNFSIAAKDNTPESQYKRIFYSLQDAKRRRKNQVMEIKIALSDLEFYVHVSTAGSTSSAVKKKGKDLTFGPDEPFHIEVDVSEFGFTIDSLKDVKLMWEVGYRNYEKVFMIAETTKSVVDTNLGWFTDKLEDSEGKTKGISKNLVGDVKPSFNGNLLEKIRFGIADSSCDCESLFLDDVLRYFQRCLEV